MYVESEREGEGRGEGGREEGRKRTSSIIGPTTLARAGVVVIRPCSMRAVIRFLEKARSCTREREGEVSELERKKEREERGRKGREVVSNSPNDGSLVHEV